MYEGVIVGTIIFGFIILSGVIVVAVFYLKNLQDMLNECDPNNRQIPPANVWLMFIPLFNVVYRFIMYPKISETLKREFESRNAHQQGDYLKGLGLGLSIVGVFSIIPYRPIRTVVGLAALILMIVYWVKAAEMKNKLRSLPKNDSGIRMSGNPDLLD